MTDRGHAPRRAHQEVANALWCRASTARAARRRAALDLAEQLRRLAAPTRQCLNRRIGYRAALVHEAQAWQVERNPAQVTIDWQFATTDAPIKLKRLYPVMNEQDPAQLSTRLLTVNRQRLPP